MINVDKQKKTDRLLQVDSSQYIAPGNILCDLSSVFCLVSLQKIKK